MAEENQEPEVEDKELVRLAQEGDTVAFSELVDRYHSRIYTLTFQMTSSREDAEDLAVQVYVSAHAECSTHTSPSSRCSVQPWHPRNGAHLKQNEAG